MKDLKILPMEEGQAGEVSALIGQVLLKVNIRDYPEQDLRDFAAYYSPETVRSLMSGGGHSYVAMEGGRVVACGSIVPLPQEGVREIRALFVLPEAAGQGVGRALMAALESDPLFTGARRVLVSSSLTAHLFYKKLGYRYVGGVPVCEDNDHYWMEKTPDPTP